VCSIFSLYKKGGVHFFGFSLFGFLFFCDMFLVWTIILEKINRYDEGNEINKKKFNVKKPLTILLID
jgi:hypothetical protein